MRDVILSEAKGFRVTQRNQIDVLEEINMRKIQVVILVLFLVGCSSSQTTPPTATTSSSPIIEVSITYTAVPPTQTLTSTLTSTPTLIPLPTWTPFPTFSPAEGVQSLATWLQATTDCLLPCWAGITPQKTTWSEAQQIIQRLTSIADVKTFLNRPCPFGICNYAVWSSISNSNTYGSFYSRDFEENKIQFMQLQIGDPALTNAISLQRALSLYGKPALVLLSTDPDQPGQKYLELILVYPERQFLIRYAHYAEINNKSIQSCGQASIVELVVVNNPYQLESLDAIAHAPETESFKVDLQYKSIKEAAGMSIDKFYETYRKANTPCIFTPVEIWIP